VSDFLVEVYLSPTAVSPRRPSPEDLADAAELLSREGRPVRFVRSLFVPEEETCFYLFEAQTSDDVREVATRAGLAFDHVAEASSAWPSRPHDVITPGPDTGRAKSPAPRRRSSNDRPEGAEDLTRAAGERPTGRPGTTINQPK